MFLNIQAQTLADLFDQTLGYFKSLKSHSNIHLDECRIRKANWIEQGRGLWRSMEFYERIFEDRTAASSNILKFFQFSVTPSITGSIDHISMTTFQFPALLGGLNDRKSRGSARVYKFIRQYILHNYSGIIMLILFMTIISCFLL